MKKSHRLALTAAAFLIPGILLIIIVNKVYADIIAGMIFGVGLCVFLRMCFPKKEAAVRQPTARHFTPQPTQTLAAVENPILNKIEEAIAEEAATLQQAVALGIEFRRKKRHEVEAAVDEILELFMEAAGAKLPYCTIAVFFPTMGDEYAMRRCKSNSAFVDKSAMIVPRRGILGTILAEGPRRHYEPNFTNKTSTLYYYDEGHEFTPEESIRSVMLTPVDSAGSAILLVDSTRQDAYTEADRDFLDTVAKLMGIAVYNTYTNSQHSVDYQRLKAMRSIETTFWQNLEFDAVMDKMRDIIPHATLCDRLTISLKDENSLSAAVIRAYGEGAEEFLGLRFPLGRDGETSLASVTYDQNFVFSRNFVEDRYEIRYTESEPKSGTFASFMAVPFGVDTLKGLMFLESTRKDAFSKFDVDLLSGMGTSAGIALEKIFMIKKVEEMATHDSMTGLYNRRRFLELLSTKISACARYNEQLSLVICDIDHFKKINDTYDHAGGDIVIKGIAAKLQNSIRLDIDVAARYGGEEFVLILDKMSHDEAKEKVDKIRESITKMAFTAPDGREMRTSMSFGIASYPYHTKEMNDLINTADKALYTAKNSGRNRVEIFGIAGAGAR